MSRERRQGYRIDAKVRIHSRSETNFFTGYTADLSEGGVFFATRQLLPVGTIVSFDLVLDQKETLHITGMVRWVRDTNMSMGHTPPGMGIQFMGMSVDMEERIKTYIEVRREALFFDLEAV
jgi:uncharacterized protein (TIGR02266 family)